MSATPLPDGGTAGRPAENRRSGHPVMYGRPRPVRPFGRMPHGGGYPLNFLDFAYDELGVDDPARVLHLCSGSLRVGVRVDIRATCRPSVVADALRLPFPAATFRWVLADPPYSELLARRHFGTAYPRPAGILREAARVTVPGGRVGILHYQTPYEVPGLTRRGVHAVYLGPGTRLRAFTVFDRVTSSAAPARPRGDETRTTVDTVVPRDETTAAPAGTVPGDETTTCPICAGPLARAEVGRPRRYCSPACRQAAYRTRST